MRLSSGGRGAAGLVGQPVSDDRVQNIDASAGQREDGLVVSLAFGSLAPVVGLAGRVTGDRDEGGLVEDAFEGSSSRSGDRV